MIIKYEKNVQMVAKLAEPVLRRGGIVIYPTETSYALGCMANNTNALSKIFKLKKRAEHKKLPVVVANKKMAKRFFKINLEAKILMDKFMPGPLTLIVRAKKAFPKAVGHKRIAFRISSEKIASLLSKVVDFPLISTSANLSGSTNIYREEELLRFDSRVNLIISKGNLKPRVASTVYDTIKGIIVRKGPVTKKQIMEAVGDRA